MTNNSDGHTKGLSSQAKQDLVRGAIIVVGFVVLGLGLLLGLNPMARWRLVRGFAAFQGETPLALTVVHTNDAWGYTLACG